GEMSEAVGDGLDNALGAAEDDVDTDRDELSGAADAHGGGASQRHVGGDKGRGEGRCDGGSVSGLDDDGQGGDGGVVVFAYFGELIVRVGDSDDPIIAGGGGDMELKRLIEELADGEWADHRGVAEHRCAGDETVGAEIKAGDEI